MKKKKVGRPKGQKMTQDHKDKIAETQRKKAAHRKRTGYYARRASRKAKEKLHLRSYSLSELKKNMLIFTIVPGVRPIEVGLDFKNESVTISIPNMPMLTSDFGFTRGDLKDLMRELETKYEGRIIETPKIYGNKKAWKKSQKRKVNTPQYQKLKQVEKKGREIGAKIIQSIKDGNWDKETK